jgi:hypothetical protein
MRFHGANLFLLQRTGSFAILIKIDSLHPSPARFSMRRSCYGGHTPPTPTSLRWQRRCSFLKPAEITLYPSTCWYRPSPASSQQVLPSNPCLPCILYHVRFQYPALHPLPCSRWRSCDGHGVQIRSRFSLCRLRRVGEFWLELEVM